MTNGGAVGEEWGRGQSRSPDAIRTQGLSTTAALPNSGWNLPEPLEASRNLVRPS